MAKKRVSAAGRTAAEKIIPVPIGRTRSFPLHDAVLTFSVIGAVLFAYAPALRGTPIWDDAAHLTGPAFESLRGLWRIWFEPGATQQYYPLLHTAFWLEHRLWGDAILGYHLTNIVLHAISACLVVHILRRLSLPGAPLAGLVFALHPVCVEAVAWISEQKSTLSGVFYLGAALLFLRFDHTRRRSHYLWALALFVLALLSKTVTATLPAALLVVLWWRGGRLSFRKDIRPLLPWLALGATAGLFTAWVERTYIGAQGPDFALSWMQRVLLAGRAICFYASKIVWPANLVFTYPHWQIDAKDWSQYLYIAVAFAVLVGFCLLARCGRRGPLAAFLFFTGTLFPVLGFLNVYPFRFSFVADHFQYLASLGIIIPLAWGLVFTANAIGLPGQAKLASAAALVALLGMLTWRQSSTYIDAEILYRTTVARNPASWMAHTNLGVVFADTPSRLPEAIAEYRAALLLKPDDAQTHANLGNALMRLGVLREAITEFQTALRLKPSAIQTHNDYGVALSQMPGQLPDAIVEFREALRLKPEYAEAHANLGAALAQEHDHVHEAIAEFEAALRIKPDYPDARKNLARALEQDPERLPDAIGEFQTAVRLKPDDPDAHNDLGVDLAQMPGRLPAAIAEFQAALRLKPDYLEARENLANALAQTPGRLEDAVTEYQQVLRINPDDAQAHNGLGVALAQMPGHMPEAVGHFQTALKLRPDYADARSNLARICPGCASTKR